jgi:outer membrane protein assembly factor BamB
VSRRKLLWAAAVVPVAAAAGAGIWEATRHGHVASPAQPKNPAGKSVPATRVARWQAHLPFGPKAVIAASNGTVALSGGLDGPKGSLVRALDASTGKPLWSYTSSSGEIERVSVGPQGVYLSTNPVSALRPSDGKVLWTSPYTPIYGPVADGGKVFIAEGTLYAVSGEHGTLLWQYPADVTSDFVVHGGMLYTLGAEDRAGGQTQSLLRAIRTLDGRQAWETQGPLGGVVVTDGQVVCAAPNVEVGEPGRLIAWRARDGKRLWATPQNQKFSSPAMGTGMVYAVRTDDRLVAFRAESGTEVWNYPATSGIRPAATPVAVYAGDSFGRLVALRPEDGTLLWTFPHRFTAGPVLTDAMVLVTNGRTLFGVPV